MDNAAPTKKPRTPREKIYRVEDAGGRGGFYRAHTTTQARAFHVDQIEAREATIEEIMHIGKAGIAVGGLDAPDEDPAQADLVGAAPQE